MQKGVKGSAGAGQKNGAIFCIFAKMREFTKKPPCESVRHHCEDTGKSRTGRGFTVFPLQKSPTLFLRKNRDFPQRKKPANAGGQAKIGIYRKVYFFVNLGRFIKQYQFITQGTQMQDFPAKSPTKNKVEMLSPGPAKKYTFLQEV